VRTDTLDRQALAVALDPGYRATAEDAAWRSSKALALAAAASPSMAPRFELAFRRFAGWSAWPTPSLGRELDYWIFLDGQIGQVAGSANGELAGRPDALQAR
jgi:hypothetical protein